MNGVANVHFWSFSHSVDIIVVACWVRWLWRNPKIIRKLFCLLRKQHHFLFSFRKFRKDLSDFKTCSRILIPPLSLRWGTPIFFARLVLLLIFFPPIEAVTTFIVILVSSVLVRLVASINVFALVKIFSADFTVSDSSGSISFFFFL